MSLSQVKEIVIKNLLDCNQERKRNRKSNQKQEEYYQHLQSFSDEVFILLEKVHDQILKIISIISLMILLNYMEIV